MTTPNFEEFQKFSKQQLDAVSAATATVAKGLQEIAAESSDYSKKAFAASSAVVEKLLGAKSVESAIQIQTEYAKSAYKGFVAEATKINEIYVKLATEASSRSRPLSPRRRASKARAARGRGKVGARRPERVGEGFSASSGAGCRAGPFLLRASCAASTNWQSCRCRVGLWRLAFAAPR